MTQSRNEFEAKWKSAKKTIKEKELEIQKVGNIPVSLFYAELR